MKKLPVLVVLCLVVAACGAGDGELSGEQREWCTLGEASEEAATRFDIIFETGLELNLGMDAVNATAVQLRDQYETAGMTSDEAVAAVSGDLFDMEVFVTACQAAYDSEVGG